MRKDAGVIHIDGSQGEGGGQIVRNAVTLSAITGVPLHIEHIRAGRKPRGLRPQHVTAIQAAADICDAAVDELAPGAETLTFEPRAEVTPGAYEWAVGTAGSAVLVAQTVLLPLALAGGRSSIRVHGGTHVPNAPPGHYQRDVYMPLLLRLGADVEVYMETYGWMPEGGGVILAQIRGGATLRSLDMRERGRVERVFGTAVGCNLPSHIPQRMANRATNLLGSHLEAPLDIRPQRTRSVSTGAGIFLAVEYTNGRAGFGCLGRQGMPSEAVAERAITDLLDFHTSSAAVDHQLADQLVLPLALAEGPSVIRTNAITSHCRTAVDVVRAFVERPVTIDERSRTVTFSDS